MVPIYDTDVAERGLVKSEWREFEFWEKLEARARRKKRYLISATICVFVALSSVPVFRDRLPKWGGLSLTRKIATEISRVKRDASLRHMAYRIRFKSDTAALSLGYAVEELPNCSAGEGSFVREGVFKSAYAFGLLSRQQGVENGIPGLIEEFCYDSLAGSFHAANGEEAIGIGIIPVSDLAPEHKRFDRLSVLVLSGASAEISFQ